MPQVGEIRTNPNNPQQKARWDGRQWVDASGPKSAPAWGAGAVELPDGSVVRYGPRGGTTILKRGGGSDGASLPDLTEGQGKAAGLAGEMVVAERNYQRARESGYDPGSPRNAFASFLEALPWGTGGGLATAVRDDVSDLGFSSELQFSDAALKLKSGAAAPEPEVRRGIRMYFPRPGENVSSVEPFRNSARVGVYENALMQAGPARTAVAPLPHLPGPGQSKVKPTGLTPAQTSAARRFKGTKAPSGTQQNPSIPTTRQQYERLPPGTVFIDFDGQIVRKR
jgi:hypothetical protein